MKEKTRYDRPRAQLRLDMSIGNTFSDDRLCASRVVLSPPPGCAKAKTLEIAMARTTMSVHRLIPANVETMAGLWSSLAW